MPRHTGPEQPQQDQPTQLNPVLRPGDDGVTQAFSQPIQPAPTPAPRYTSAQANELYQQQATQAMPPIVDPYSGGEAYPQGHGNQQVEPGASVFGGTPVHNAQTYPPQGAAPNFPPPRRSEPTRYRDDYDDDDDRERVRESTNTKLVVIITILLMIIAAFIGFFVYKAFAGPATAPVQEQQVTPSTVGTESQKPEDTEKQTPSEKPTESEKPKESEKPTATPEPTVTVTVTEKPKVTEDNNQKSGEKDKQDKTTQPGNGQPTTNPGDKSGGH